MTFCGAPAPLLGNYGFVNNSLTWQINGQAPSEVAGHSSCPVVVTDTQGHSLSTTVTVSEDPNLTFALFSVPVTTAQGSATDPIITTLGGQFILPAGHSIAGLPPGSERQATPGEWLTAWGTGCGTASPGIADGLPAGFKPLSMAPVEVNIGGQGATVEFSGMAPGFVGLCQINFQVPTGLSAGTLQPLGFGLPGQVSIANYQLPIAAP